MRRHRRRRSSPSSLGSKQTPPQLPVWEYSDRILGAFNDKEASQDFAALSGLDLGLGKILGLKGGHFEVVIVDEDAKINVNTWDMRPTRSPTSGSAKSS